MKNKINLCISRLYTEDELYFIHFILKPGELKQWIEDNEITYRMVVGTKSTTTSTVFLIHEK